MKKKAVSTHGKTKLTKKLVNKLTLRQALVSGVKAQTGRKDIEFRAAADIAATTQRAIPIEERAGYPLKRARGSVDPKNWKTATGVKLEVDFSRAWWMPDDWGQAIKPTKPTSHSTGGGGGILTTFVAPDGKTCFFHKERCEEHMGRPFTKADGFNGQVRLAKLQALQSVQLARRQIKASKTGSQQLIGTDSDSTLFNILSPKADLLQFAMIERKRNHVCKSGRCKTVYMSSIPNCDDVSETQSVAKRQVKELTAAGNRRRHAVYAAYRLSGPLTPVAYEAGIDHVNLLSSGRRLVPGLTVPHPEEADRLDPEPSPLQQSTPSNNVSRTRIGLNCIMVTERKCKPSCSVPTMPLRRADTRFLSDYVFWLPWRQ